MKTKTANEDPRIHHAHVWGLREGPGGKYAFLKKHTVRDTNWQELQPDAPFYLFAPQDIDLRNEYDRGWKITDVMPVNSVGIVTARDHLTIHWSHQDVWSVIQDFAALQSEQARKKYDLGNDARDWKVELAQKDVRRSGPSKAFVKPVLYRPFDTRWTYYTGQTRGFICMPRPEVMRHMLVGRNLGLTFPRSISAGKPFSHVICARSGVLGRFFPDAACITYFAPLYLYPTADRADLLAHLDSSERQPNLNPTLLSSLTQAYGKTPSPEEIFHYSYAVLYAPAYRKRYAEFLKIDFPRLPLTGSLDLFRALARLGGELVALHLLESPNLDKPRTEFIGGRNPVVEKVSWSRQTVWIDKAQATGFRGVPEAVWNFHIGGYQVCEKWLKDRKGRSLTKDDITHYQRIVIALSETIRLMAEIDKVIEKHGGWPGAFSATPS